MTVPLLVVAGVVAAVAVLSVWVHALVKRSAKSLSFAGQASFAAFAPLSPVPPIRLAAMPEGLRSRLTRDVRGTGYVSGLTKSEAEDYLDWLEANGFTHRQLALAPDGFVIRFR
jgi:hypothetical protein